MKPEFWAIWAKFLENLKNHTNEAYHSYIDLMACEQVGDERWELTFPDPATTRWFETNLSDKVTETLSEMGVNVTVAYGKSCDDSQVAESVSQSVLPFNTQKRVSSEVNLDASEAGFRMSNSWKNRTVTVEQSYDSNLNSAFTFDTFINGRSNEIAYAAAKAVARDPGVKAPLLYLYGGVGLGKTHLMHAIGNEIQRTKKLRVRYMTSETFTNELIEAIGSKTMTQFRARNRTNCDVLLLDDIQFIGGKETTMEELFHTFNDFANSHRQIVITSDKRPSEIKKLEERLISRCEGGLCYDIQQPDFETRMAILISKAKRDNIVLTNEVAEYIASKVSTNIRELEGTLKSLSFTADIRNCMLTRKLAMEVLEPLARHQEEKVDLSVIIARVCEYYGVSNAELTGRSRKKPIVHPRQIAQYIAHKHCGLSYPEIARAFERDHTSVLNSCQVIEEELKSNTATIYEIRKLEESLFH